MSDINEKEFEIHYDGTCPLCENFMCNVSKSEKARDIFLFSTNPPAQNAENFEKGIAVTNNKTGEILWKEDALLLIGKNLDGWRGRFIRLFGLLPKFLRRIVYNIISFNRHFLSNFIKRKAPNK
ncbi:MAG: hypothetical protein CMJ26_00260 [Phycisphaerae bacterium]|nr:hypothetical protein [Phycisphaerae bacterium]